MKRRSQTASIVLNDPLDAVPIIPDGVEMRDDSEGNRQLRVTPEVVGFRKRIARWLGQDYSSVAVLDEHGTQFIRAVDGRRTLRDVVDLLAASSGRSRQDVEEGVVLFTRKLMVKNMIALKVPAIQGDSG